LEKLLSLLKESGLLLAHGRHRLEELHDLGQVVLSLFALVVHIGDEQLKFASPRNMGLLKLVLELDSLSFNRLELSREAFNLLVIVLLLNLGIRIV